MGIVTKFRGTLRIKLMSGKILQKNIFYTCKTFNCVTLTEKTGKALCSNISFCSFDSGNKRNKNSIEKFLFQCVNLKRFVALCNFLFFFNFLFYNTSNHTIINFYSKPSLVQYTIIGIWATLHPVDLLKEYSTSSWLLKLIHTGAVDKNRKNMSSKS